MKNIVKSLIAGVSLLVCAASVNAQINVASPTATLTTNFTFTLSGTTNVCLFTNPCKIASVQLIASTGNTFAINLYDNNVTNFTYTNAAYTNIVVYTTNFVNTTVSGLTGVTNVYTNSMLFETNSLFAAATNQLPSWYFAAPPSTIVTYPRNQIMSKGIGIQCSAVTNGTVIIQYRIND